MGKYVNPYETDAHRKYVDEGNCASIHRSKAWCNGKRFHTGLHWALFLHKGTKVSKKQWNNSEVHQVPAKQ